MKLDSLKQFIDNILNRTVSRSDFSELVIQKWKSKKFVEFYDNVDSLREKVWSLSFDRLVTEHGRIEDQPLSISQHLFGDLQSVAARVVYDPPTINKSEHIEYHTHPVNSLIVVLDGTGTCSLLYENKELIDVPLKPGASVFFCSNVIHRIKEIGVTGLEILNITERVNQPAYRSKLSTQKNLVIDSSKDFLQMFEIEKTEAITYEKFLELRSGIFS